GASAARFGRMRATTMPGEQDLCLLAGDRRAELGGRLLPVRRLPDGRRGGGVLAYELLPGGGQLRREVRGGRVAEPSDPDPDREREHGREHPGERLSPV